jgi:hypothetical protein
MSNIVTAAVNSDDWSTNNDLYFSSSKNKDIMIVVIKFPYVDRLVESRIDYVFENDIWQFSWLGVRSKCLNDKESDWNTPKSGDCAQ